jgi:hypothetical protein
MFYLPQGLIALLVASPIWATIVVDSQLSLADPFYHISRQVPKQQQEPVCCLRPLDPQEPVPELLSFEEWKGRQMQQKVDPGPSVPPMKQTEAEEAAREASIVGAHPNQQPTTEVVPNAPVPFDQLPLEGRFNYASEDCSARIHKTHKGAQSAPAVLSRKKDKYMLSPCSTKDKFMVVELCDDIRIDTVQLANYEFFSGVFRTIKISVSQTYTSDTEGWVEMGTYDAKNVRSVQVYIYSLYFL